MAISAGDDLKVYEAILKPKTTQNTSRTTMGSRNDNIKTGAENDAWMLGEPLQLARTVSSVAS